MSSRDGKLRALIVQHEGATPAGYVSEWLDERGADVDVLRIDVEEREVDPRDYGLLVSLGSEFAAFDDSVPWLGREMRLFREASEADVPHLGICFGGQLLARTLGGESFRGRAGRNRLASGPDPRPLPRLRGTVVPVAFRHVHAAARRDRDSGDRRGPPGLRRRPKHGRPVPPGGNAADDGELGRRLPARARR